MKELSECIDKRAELMKEIREYKKNKSAILAKCLNFLLIGNLDNMLCSCGNLNTNG